jgi:choline dehydrogenase-like flavoprotein
MIRDLAASDDSRLTAQCSVCVIGGGVAGLIAASRLSASGRRVIVLESGGLKPHDQLQALNIVEQAGETYQTAITGRVRALGGTSNTWGGRIMPLAPHDMAPRDYLGLKGWPIERADLERFVPEIERLFRVDRSSYEELPASVLTDSLAAGRLHMTPRWSKWPTFRRRNVAHLLRDKVTIKPNPEIWLGATVCDLLFDAAVGRLSGVEARSINGRRLTVLADWFVLAAGTFEATRILLQLHELTDGRAFSGCNALG